VNRGDDRHANPDYSDDAWWNEIVEEQTQNQPVQYKMTLDCPTGQTGGHAFVVDGWEVYGDPPQRHVHVNFGWGGAHIEWSLLNELPCADGNEGRLFDLHPNQGVPASISGTYSGDHYFGWDASGANATFSAGSWLQFLPAVTVSNNGGPTDAIIFRGSATDMVAVRDSRKCVRLFNGAVKLFGKGALRIGSIDPPRYVKTRTIPTPGVSLSWNPGRGSAEGGVIIERVISGGVWSVIWTVNAPDNFYADFDVKSGRTYRYRLRSTSHGNLSGYTDVTPDVHVP
jgi:hypothetical protein